MDLPQLVDAMLERASTEHPGVEYNITVPEEVDMDLPPTADRVWRETSQGIGFYNGLVYRDSLVDVLPTKPWLVIPSPWDSTTAKPYYGDLRSGHITTSLPDDARFK